MAEGAVALAAIGLVTAVLTLVVKPLFTLPLEASNTYNNTISADNARTLSMRNSTGAPDDQASYTDLLTGLSAGSTTFTLKYRVTAGTGTFTNRTIAVIPL